MSKFQKYLNFVTALGWSLFIICLLGISVLVFAFLHKESKYWKQGHRSRITQGRVMADIPKTEKPRIKVVNFGTPIILLPSQYIMITIGQSLVSPDLVDEYKKDFGTQYTSGYSSSSNYSNILFVRKDDGESHLLLDKKAAITTFSYFCKDETGKNKTLTNLLLFGIVDKDYNRDGFLTSADAEIAYISDFSGKNLIPITPPDTCLVDFKVDENRKIIYLIYREDSDKNLRFNALDQTYMIEVDALTGKRKATIIDKQLTEKIKAIVY